MHIVTNIKYSSFYLYCQYKFQKNQHAVSGQTARQAAGPPKAFRRRLWEKNRWEKGSAAKGEVL
jgi:hydroxyacyl-ACP dehydratase HTD2-like protein with hotdog domain